MWWRPRKRRQRRRTPMSSFGFFSGDAGNAEESEENTLEAELTAGWVVPLLEGMRATAISASSDGDGVDARRKRDIGVGGRALDARLIADSLVGCSQGGEQRRVGFEFTAGAAAEQLDLERQLAFGAVARRF